MEYNFKKVHTGKDLAISTIVLLAGAGLFFVNKGMKVAASDSTSISTRPNRSRTHSCTIFATTPMNRQPESLNSKLTRQTN